MIDVIKSYFPKLTPLQIEQFESMMQLYPEWNEKINVISRKDIGNLEINHLLHSLSIARFIQFVPNSRILDLGAGGGFPSIPLAVMFPDVHFHLVDRIGKKLRVAASIAEATDLKNVSMQHGDIGECHERFDFIVSRAVMSLSDLLRLSRNNICKEQKNGIPNGLIALKGGDVNEEIKACHCHVEVEKISQWFPNQDFFATKLVTYVPMS